MFPTVNFEFAKWYYVSVEYLSLSVSNHMSPCVSARNNVNSAAAKFRGTQFHGSALKSKIIGPRCVLSKEGELVISSGQQLWQFSIDIAPMLGGAHRFGERLDAVNLRKSVGSLQFQWPGLAWPGLAVIKRACSVHRLIVLTICLIRDWNSYMDSDRCSPLSCFLFFLIIILRLEMKITSE